MFRGIILAVLCYSCFANLYPIATNQSDQKLIPSQSKEQVNLITQTPEPSKTILEYSKFLLEEFKSHRNFLEFYYNLTLGAFTAIATLFLFFIGFMNWQSKQEIEKNNKAYKNDLKENADKLLQDALEENEKRINERHKEIDEQLDNIKQGLKKLEPYETQLKDKLKQFDLVKIELQKQVQWQKELFYPLLTNYEKKHLKYLKANMAQDYKVTHKVIYELRKLARLRLIERLDGKTIGEMRGREKVDISKYVKVTESGEDCLNFLKKLELLEGEE
ncbi:MAG: hypothetical protein QNJ38_01235 [Prochloraceae cyanobacterium]|nr:hypothetical protein [Prochloraceae cyanobacterium]